MESRKLLGDLRYPGVSRSGFAFSLNEEMVRPSLKSFLFLRDVRLNDPHGPDRCSVRKRFPQIGGSQERLSVGLGNVVLCGVSYEAVHEGKG